jgi:hypothetical protein
MYFEAISPGRNIPDPEPKDKREWREEKKERTSSQASRKDHLKLMDS